MLLDVRLASKYEAGHAADCLSCPLYLPIQAWDVPSIIRRAGFAFFGIFGTGAMTFPPSLTLAQAAAAAAAALCVCVCMCLFVHVRVCIGCFLRATTHWSGCHRRCHCRAMLTAPVPATCRAQHSICRRGGSQGAAQQAAHPALRVWRQPGEQVRDQGDSARVCVRPGRVCVLWGPAPASCMVLHARSNVLHPTCV